MYRMKPYYSSNVQTKDVFDLFDNFFTERKVYDRSFNVDIRDLKDKYIVEAELPGVKKEDLSIKYENETLTIKIATTNEVEDDKDSRNYIYRERRTIRNERSMHLKDVDPTKLNAKLEHGILSITLSKLEHKINSYLIDVE